MVYLVIKELADTAEDVIMVTSSVMKDVAGSGGRGAGEQEVYRANAIRALCRIIDVSLYHFSLPSTLPRLSRVLACEKMRN